MSTKREPSSYKDPAGFVFTEGETLYRAVMPIYAGIYDRLMASGLYNDLVAAGDLIPHAEVRGPRVGPAGAYKILRPQFLPFISYPYEWSFGQLKDAALTTLRIQQAALEHGMILKDASPANIQFANGKPSLVDSLSFAIPVDGKPWDAYRQFCEQFLAPLVLMSFVDIRLSGLMRSYPDGIPLDLAARLLPWRAKMRPRILTHIVLHSRMQTRVCEEGLARANPRGTVSRNALQGLTMDLAHLVASLDWQPAGKWEKYYEQGVLSAAYLRDKQRIVEGFVRRTGAQTAWDLGANTGVFSIILAKAGCTTIAIDDDPACVETAYRRTRESGETKVLPILGGTNPTPGLGWDNVERRSLLGRGPADLVLVLGLVHHLAIGGNISLAMLADLMAKLGTWLIIEFVPREDPNVATMLRFRKDIFSAFTREEFERAFRRRFRLLTSVQVSDSTRTIYLMRKK